MSHENHQGHFPPQTWTFQTAEVRQTPLQPHGPHKTQENSELTIIQLLCTCHFRARALSARHLYIPLQHDNLHMAGYLSFPTVTGLLFIIIFLLFSPFYLVYYLMSTYCIYIDSPSTLLGSTPSTHIKSCITQGYRLAKPVQAFPPLKGEFPKTNNN